MKALLEVKDLSIEIGSKRIVDSIGFHWMKTRP